MSKFTAIYEKGVFRPIGPVDLPEGSTVQVEAEPSRSSEDLARERIFAFLARSYETGDPQAAARHNEHQP